MLEHGLNLHRNIPLAIFTFICVDVKVVVSCFHRSCTVHFKKQQLVEQKLMENGTDRQLFTSGDRRTCKQSITSVTFSPAQAAAAEALTGQILLLCRPIRAPVDALICSCHSFLSG